MVHIRKFGIGCWIPWTWYHCLTNLEEKYWNIIFSSFSVLKPDACDPSPCGPGTMCMSDMGNPICRCLAGLIPKPDAITGCGPEGKVQLFREGHKNLRKSSTHMGSPTYTKITNTVSTTTIFGLCMCKWGIFANFM